MRDNASVAVQPAMLLIPIKRIEVADAIAEIADGVTRRVLKVRAFGTQLKTNHILRVSDGLVGDFAFGGSGPDVLLRQV
ncbi:MAG: hypothetical protein WCE20_13590 [Rhizomicrobium sp.]